MRDISSVYEAKMTSLRTQYNESIVATEEVKKRSVTLDKTIMLEKEARLKQQEREKKIMNERSEMIGEYDIKISKLEDEVRTLMEENGRLTNELYETGQPLSDYCNGGVSVLEREVGCLKKRLLLSETEYDNEKEEMLLQIVSLEMTNKNEAKRR